MTATPVSSYLLVAILASSHLAVATGYEATSKFGDGCGYFDRRFCHWQQDRADPTTMTSDVATLTSDPMAVQLGDSMQSSSRSQGRERWRLGVELEHRFGNRRRRLVCGGGRYQVTPWQRGSAIVPR